MNAYFKVISLVERLHRQFLELVKLELEGFGIHDINNVQGMMLFSKGAADQHLHHRNTKTRAEASAGATEIKNRDSRTGSRPSKVLF